MAILDMNPQTDEERMTRALQETISEMRLLVQMSAGRIVSSIASRHGVSAHDLLTVVRTSTIMESMEEYHTQETLLQVFDDDGTVSINSDDDVSDEGTTGDFFGEFIFPDTPRNRDTVVRIVRGLEPVNLFDAMTFETLGEIEGEFRLNMAIRAPESVVVSNENSGSESDSDVDNV